MSDPAPPSTREARLAEQLRANLRRRKAQARELSGQMAEQEAEPASPDALAGTQTRR